MTDFFEALGQGLGDAVERRRGRRELATTVLVAAAAVAIVVVLVLTLRPGHDRSASSPQGNPFPGAPHSQRFPEAGRCPAASPSRYLPRGAGCVTVRRDDVDGDGRPDLVLLYARSTRASFAGPRRSNLDVWRASGGRLRARLTGDINASLAWVRDVNARAGAELFVHANHVTTAEYMGVYAFDGDGVRRAGTFGYDGQEAVVREGFTCHPPATIVQHVFEADTPLTRHTWRPTTTTYRWVGATLRRAGTRHGGSAPLPRREVGAHC